MTKYERLHKALAENGKGSMKCFGNSMTPILKSGSTISFEKKDEYKVGDIVFCKVKGRVIDCHKITAKDKTKGYLISNNKGWDNGWTKTIYGKAVLSVFKPKNNGQIEIKDL